MQRPRLKGRYWHLRNRYILNVITKSFVISFPTVICTVIDNSIAHTLIYFIIISLMIRREHFRSQNIWGRVTLLQFCTHLHAYELPCLLHPYHYLTDNYLIIGYQSLIRFVWHIYCITMMFLQTLILFTTFRYPFYIINIVTLMIFYKRDYNDIICMHFFIFG